MKVSSSSSSIAPPKYRSARKDIAALGFYYKDRLADFFFLPFFIWRFLWSDSLWSSRLTAMGKYQKKKKVACSRNVETIPYNYFVYIVHAGLCLCVGCFTTIRSGRRNEALRIYKLKGSVLPTFPLAGQGHEILDCWPPFSLVMMSLRVQMFSTDDFRYPLHDVHPQVGSQLLSIFFFFRNWKKSWNRNNSQCGPRSPEESTGGKWKRKKMNLLDMEQVKRKTPTCAHVGSKNNRKVPPPPHLVCI